MLASEFNPHVNVSLQRIVAHYNITSNFLPESHFEKDTLKFKSWIETYPTPTITYGNRDLNPSSTVKSTVTTVTKTNEYKYYLIS